MGSRRWKEMGKEKRTAASRSAGLFVQCLYPIVLSNPFMSSENRPRTFLVVSTALQRKEENRGRGARKRGGEKDAHMSVTLVARAGGCKLEEVGAVRAPGLDGLAVGAPSA